MYTGMLTTNIFRRQTVISRRLLQIKKMSSRERNDILPEHNEGMTVIPQILTNQAEDFLSLTKELREYGYDTVNLNLGCPSGTVVAKRRGSGAARVAEYARRVSR